MITAIRLILEAIAFLVLPSRTIARNIILAFAIGMVGHDQADTAMPDSVTATVYVCTMPVAPQVIRPLARQGEAHCDAGHTISGMGEKRW